ncbi:MAG: GLPGLI family protein [Chitinophagaceae bacterium]|nr:GLPGLI family protein [Chitinophagaceae bacterium]
MKRIALLLVLTLTGSLLWAQQTQGRIVYERTSKLRIQIGGDNPAFANAIPQERKDRFELLFANNQTLWRAMPDMGEDEMSFGGEGAQIRMIMPGSQDISFSDLPEMRKVDYRELFGKNFLVADTINRLNWKLSDETKEILGHKCRKATSSRTQASMRMNNDNGVITRQEITDTLEITAWFATDMPVFAGPLIYQGQLPGAVLEVTEGDRVSIVAVEISDKVDTKEIKEPKGGKKITQAEFVKEREKMMKEMQENGGMQFRMRN